MELLTSNNLIIAASIILILSFWFNGIAKKTNIPSVLMFIAMGDELDKEYRARDESYEGIAHEGHVVLASPDMEVLPEDPITKKPDPEDPEERQFEG